MEETGETPGSLVPSHRAIETVQGTIVSLKGRTSCAVFRVKLETGSKGVDATPGDTEGCLRMPHYSTESSDRQPGRGDYHVFKSFAS